MQMLTTRTSSGCKAFFIVTETRFVAPSHKMANEINSVVQNRKLATALVATEIHPGRHCPQVLSICSRAFLIPNANQGGFIKSYKGWSIRDDRTSQECRNKTLVGLDLPKSK